MKLTRKQKAIAVLLFMILVVPQLYSLVINIVNPKPLAIRGPSQGPTLRVTDVRINLKTKEDALVFIVIDLGDGETYGAHITVPIYPLTKGKGGTRQ